MIDLPENETNENGIPPKVPISNSIRSKIRKLAISGECPNPIDVTFEDISAAAYRIKSGIRRTPCEVGFDQN